MSYQIVTVNAVKFLGTDFAAAAEKLSELVNEQILKGWKPLGGVAVGGTQQMHEPHLFQAMIRE
jgi:hypothetical protein